MKLLQMQVVINSWTYDSVTSLIESNRGIHCKQNDPNTIRFSDEDFGPNDIDQLSDLAWETLCRYIANNTHLEEIAIFENMSITDAKMVVEYSTHCTKLKLRCAIVVTALRIEDADHDMKLMI